MPSKMDPQQLDPQRLHPQQLDPQQLDPQRLHPQQLDPQQLDPQQLDPQQLDPQQLDPQRLHPQQQDLVQQIEVLDADEVPPQYRVDRVTLGRGRQPDNRGHNNTSRRNIPKDQSTLPSRGATGRVDGHGAYRPAPANDSPGIFKKLTDWYSSPKRPSAKEAYEQRMRKRQNNTDHQPEEVYRGDGTTELIPRSQNDIIELKQSFQHTLEGKEREWEEREKELQHEISQINHHLEENTRILKAKLHESESEKLFMQEQHNAFIRKQQEASFRQMESARWLPMDEGKVMGDLDRLKRDMRSWAKGTAIKDISQLQSHGEAAMTTLMQDLANVVLFENGQFPGGLSTTARSPMLLLNALLAHSVYTSFFRSPFFILGKNEGKSTSTVRPESVLEDIYERAQKGTSIFVCQIAFC
jgi:hypothetical protein